MELSNIVKKSNYINEHMSKPANFADVKAGRSMRLHAKVEERKFWRVYQFDKNRDIDVQSKPRNKVGQKQTALTGIHAKDQERLKKLYLWKAEKERKKKAAACDKQKLFISVVRTPLGLFGFLTPVKKFSAKKCIPSIPSISDRVTRSCRVDCWRKNKPNIYNFAPDNAEFHPPQLKQMHNVVFGQRPPVAKPNLANTNETNNKVKGHVGSAIADNTRGKRNATATKSEAKEVPYKTTINENKKMKNKIQEKSQEIKGCISDDSNDQKSPQHFRRQLDNEIIRLRQICNEWQRYKDENKSVIPENEQDLIFQAIGQTNLLISKKFEQFRDLVQHCEDQVLVEGEGLITYSDLQGFWDMVFKQVENIDLRFKNLMESRQNKWVKKVGVDLAPMKRAAPRTKRASALPTRKGNSKIRDRIEAARKAKEESNLSIADVSAPVLEVPVKMFDAGFFTVSSPVKERNIPAATPNKNTSLLKEVLSSEATRESSKKATASSMAMMRASYVAKRMSNNVDIYTSLDSIPPINQVKKVNKDDNLHKPQPLGNMEFLGETENNCMKITNTITEHEDKVTIVTPVVENGSSKVAKRKERKLKASSDEEYFPSRKAYSSQHTGPIYPRRSKRIASIAKD